MASNNNGGILDGGRLLSRVMQRDPELGQLLQNLIDGVNRTAQNAAVSPIGEVQAPKSPDSVSVSTAGEIMHISIDHSGPVNRNIRYFSEISPNSAQFSQPIVIDHGSSRTSHPISLPTKDSSGNTIKYYVRSYAQYPSSQPSAPTIVGGVGAPLAFTMSGSTQMTLQPSTGSGTAPNTGQGAGSGLGKVVRRTS